MDVIQVEQAEWAARNFPQNQTEDHWYVPLLGATEELGELCHAALKSAQGIRGLSIEDRQRMEKDALGDIMIYLLDFANRREYSLEDCLIETWDQVKKRDWVERPVTG